ncbi:hypothetical protein AB0H28_29185 [Micromonospora sp. NPDC050980]|uniref:hypothetical protein n=1 Tax=Micromonospora sp. NPDC050980 TaxID=3155161 RepID=UPI0033F74D29
MAKDIPALMVPPDLIDRTTGAVRDVRAFLKLPTEALAAIVQSSWVETAGRLVAAVLVHRLSGRAVVVGPFDNATEAASWWSADRNQLAMHPAMIMAVLPLLDAEDLIEEGQG